MGHSPSFIDAPASTNLPVLQATRRLGWTGRLVTTNVDDGRCVGCYSDLNRCPQLAGEQPVEKPAFYLSPSRKLPIWVLKSDLGRLKYLTHDTERERPVYFQWQLIDDLAPARSRAHSHGTTAVRRDASPGAFVK